MHHRNVPYQQPPYPYFAEHYHSPYPYTPMNAGYPATQPTPFEMYAKPKQPSMPDPYAKNHHIPGQPSGTNNLLHYFQDDNGELDVGKMMAAAGQAAKTAQQLAPVVKEVQSIMKYMNPGGRQ